MRMPSSSRSLSHLPRESTLQEPLLCRGGSTPKQREIPRLPTSGQLPRGHSSSCHFEGGRAATNEAGGGRARIQHHLLDPPGHPAREDHERRARLPRERPFLVCGSLPLR